MLLFLVKAVLNQNAEVTSAKVTTFEFYDFQRQEVVLVQISDRLDSVPILLVGINCRKLLMCMCERGSCIIISKNILNHLH